MCRARQARQSSYRQQLPIQVPGFPYVHPLSAARRDERTWAAVHPFAARPGARVMQDVFPGSRWEKGEGGAVELDTGTGSAMDSSALAAWVKALLRAYLAGMLIPIVDLIVGRADR